MPSAMPTGVVTFVFTDIEGSTRLLRALGDAYTEVLVDQRRLLRQQWDRWDGWEHATEGDSFVVAFASPNDAVHAVVDAQRALATHEWPGDLPVRVRVGVHTGEPVIADDDYVGIDVHRAARIATAAHGGQIVVSKATYDLVRERLPEGVRGDDLGEYRLKDLERPEWLYQLTVEGTPSSFPPLKSLETPSNLPSVPTATVGRNDEVALLIELLRSDDVRLVTVTGPGGAGKTRLSIEAAGRLLDDFRNGVFFVSLGAVTDAAGVLPAIAHTLAGELGTQPAPERLAVELRGKSMLLVLDNFEQVADAAPAVGELLDAAKRVKAIVSSRLALRLASERELPLEPLPRSAAVELFIQRAAAVRPGFACDADNEPTIEAICARLDGLPLAIELAASRVRTLPVEQVLQRLDRTLELRGRSRDVPDRQKTLRDTVAWSVDLLDPPARELFARMAVFPGGATLTAIEAVGGDDSLDALEALVEHSLVRTDAEHRLSMLETIREYATELLEGSADAAAVRDAQAAFFAELAKTAYVELRGPKGAEWRASLEAEQANLRAALSWTLEAGGGDRALVGAALAAAMGWFWYSTGQTHEGIRWLDLAAGVADAPMGVRALTAHHLGVLNDQAGRPDLSTPLLERAHALYEVLGDERAASRALSSLGSAIRATGDLSRARQLFEAVLVSWDALDDSLGRSNALFNLATIAIDEADGARALELLERAQVLDRERGDDWGIALDGCGIGEAYLTLGRIDDAEQALREALRALVELRELDRVAEALANLGGVAGARGDLTRGARLGGASFSLWEQIGVPPAGPDRVKVDRYLRPVRDGLAADELERAWSEGAAMTFDQAVSYALEPART